MEATKTKKKVITTTLACVLMVVLAVGGTLAYLWDVTNEIENSFTVLGANSISATLTEPNWDPDTSGKDLSPSAVIAKDPQITNTSEADGMSEYVAIQVKFTDASGTELTEAQLSKLDGLISIAWAEDSKWVTENGTNVSTLTSIGSAATTVYYYDEILSNVDGENTTPALFTSVTISSDATGDDLDWINNATAVEGVPGLSGGFQIVVEGAAIQTSGFDGNITITTGVSAADAVLAWEELEDLFE